MTHRSLLYPFLFAPFLVATCLSAQTGSVSQQEVKHIIMMVPDGMGLADVTATRIRLNGPGGLPLNFEILEHIGYQRTYSRTNTITDSSAAASAFACGEKFINNEVCLHADRAPHNPSVLELAQSKGMATGLVATQTITHATPAAFASHVANRNCETMIAHQYVTETAAGRAAGRRPSHLQAILPRCLQGHRLLHHDRHDHRVHVRRHQRRDGVGSIRGRDCASLGYSPRRA